MNGAVIEAAPAKINLYLHLLGRRADGRHELDSLVVFADIADRVTVRPAGAFRLCVTGPFAAPLEGSASSNLVMRAARALAAAAGGRRGAAMVLEKKLPVASGIGGGSADAAAVLRALQRLWRVKLPASTLRAIAEGLGADVPACLAGGALRMTGAGEILVRQPAPTRALPLVLANPGVAVSTAAVFAGARPPWSKAASPPRCRCSVPELAARLARRRNDLEIPAGRLAPEIGGVLAALRATPNCLLARMSGSGATCFGLYATSAAASSAAAILARRNPRWWVRAAAVPRPVMRRAGSGG